MLGTAAGSGNRRPIGLERLPLFPARKSGGTKAVISLRQPTLIAGSLSQRQQILVIRLASGALAEQAQDLISAEQEAPAALTITFWQPLQSAIIKLRSEE